MSGYCPDCGNTQCICTEVERQEAAPSSCTCGLLCSTCAVAALAEMNRHIEALARVRKDNAWDVINARHARDKLLASMSNNDKVERPQKARTGETE